LVIWVFRVHRKRKVLSCGWSSTFLYRVEKSAKVPFKLSFDPEIVEKWGGGIFSLWESGDPFYLIREMGDSAEKGDGGSATCQILGSSIVGIRGKYFIKRIWRSQKKGGVE